MVVVVMVGVALVVGGGVTGDGVIGGVVIDVIIGGSAIGGVEEGLRWREGCISFATHTYSYLRCVLESQIHDRRILES